MRSISFTGHRKLSEDSTALSQRIYSRLEEEIQNGATDFNTGVAVGFDCISAAVVLKLRKVYPHIKLRTCSHRICAWIFVHDFDECKAKVRRHTGVWQGLSTQQSAKFAEKTCAISYENKFLI